MNANTWQIAKEWVGDVADLPASERGAYLAGLCPYPTLRQEVLAMLAHSACLSGILMRAALERGARIGSYEIVAALGAGGMGEVYRARDLRLRRDVAIKVLPISFAQDRERSARFEREARVLACLNHPNIAQIYSLEEADGRPALVMELVEGRTLRELIRVAPGVEALKQVASQTAGAIGAAHASGILHRDIKPANVMVRPDGYVKVLDFGLAGTMAAFDVATMTRSASGAAAAVTGSGEVVGTVAYMSPEQARNDGVGAPSDVFALGVVFYEVLTGHHPFESGPGMTMVVRMLSDQPAPPSWHTGDIPPGLDALILRMIDKEPRRRPIAAEVHDQLSAIFEGAACSPRPVWPPFTDH